MSFGQLGVLALLSYLGALTLIAEIAHRARRDESPGDHFLGGRELGTWVLFFTLYATAYSGNSLLGYPGKAYRSGFSFIMATGFMMSIVVVFQLLVPKLRPAAVSGGFVTPGDWVRARFGSETRVERLLLRSIGLLMAIALANFLLAQLKAMGHVTEIITDGAVPYAWGVAGLAAFILFYETRGGMRAVAWTDAAQGIAMLFGLGALLSWILAGSGGLSAMTHAIAVERPASVAVPDAVTCAGWFSTIALLGLASVIYPQAIQRIYAARDSTSLKRSFALMGFMPLATTFVVTLIGLAAIPLLGPLEGIATDEVLPMLLGRWAEVGALGQLGAVVVFVGALAAIMSTADSCLLSLGALLAGDLLGRKGDDPRTTRLGKLCAAGLLVAMVVVAFRREITLWRLIELKMELLIQCVPAFLIAIHWRGLRAGATLAGLMVGTGFAVALTLSGVPRIGGVHVGIIGLGLNAAVAVAGSFIAAGPAMQSRTQS